MSAVIYTRDRAFSGDVNEAQARGSGFFSRLVAALYHSRKLQAAREIERHRHLIVSVSATAGKTMAGTR